MRRLGLLLAIMAYSATAHGEEEITKTRYPLALIERPMTLPQGLVTPTVRMDLYNYGVAGGVTAESLAAGLDVGVTRRLQLGLAVAFPVNPNVGFGSVLANGQFGLTRWIALRLDVGYNRFFEGGGGSSDDAVFLGLGAPIRIKVHRMLALVSGRSGAIEYSPFINRQDDQPGTSSYVGAGFPIFGADVLNYSHKNGSGSSDDVVTLNLPFGLLIQPHERVSLTLRAAYTLVHGIESIGGTSTGATLHYLPVGIDLMVAVVRQLDAGVMFSLTGPVNEDYANARLFTVFVQGHL